MSAGSAAAVAVEAPDDKKARAKTLINGALDELGRRLEAGQSDALRQYLTTCARFHRYSFRNTLLIAMQRPEATRVAGFHAWLKLQRHVRRGEKGIAILAPLVRKRDDGEPGADRQVFGFKVVYVFDIAQTDGAELAELAVHPAGDPGDGIARLEAFATARGIWIETVPRATIEDNEARITRGASGAFLLSLADDLTPAARFASLAHELGHGLLHFGEDRPKERGVRELEAEAVAWVAADAIGLDHVDGMVDYIGLYKGSRELLEESLGRIQRAAHLILEALGVASSEVQS